MAFGSNRALPVRPPANTKTRIRVHTYKHFRPHGYARRQPLGVITIVYDALEQSLGSKKNQKSSF